MKQEISRSASLSRTHVEKKLKLGKYMSLANRSSMDELVNKSGILSPVPKK